MSERPVTSVSFSAIQRIEKVCQAHGCPYFSDGTVPWDVADYSIREDEREGKEGNRLLHKVDALNHLELNNLQEAIETEFAVELNGATIYQWFEANTVPRRECIINEE